MRITKGKVVGGQIVVDDEQLEEGSNVTVLVTDERTFQLSPAEEKALLLAIADADRGDWLDAEDALREIR
jgi:hypothetical protein